MLIRHLEYFVTLAEEQHFGRAAELCGVSQPTLSQAIRKLEQDLGVALIVRGKRFMGLTAEGERVLPWGRQILSDFGSLKDDLSGRRKGGLTGQLRLGVTPAAMAALPRVTERFEERNPLARIAASPMTAEQIVQGIEGFALDGGLLWLDDAVAGNAALSRVVLAQEEMMFACPSDHPFAAEKTIPWRDAMTQPLVTLGAGFPVPGDGVGKPLIRAGITCNSLAGILAHLRGGLWCAVVPQGFAALLAPGDGIALRPMTAPALRLPLVAVLSARDPQSPMVRAFRDCLPAQAAGT
ncbi:LysR family transcriptional regulator [Sinirhodobacter populi]|uniref:LysR family transcriptional regulator n=1 Tax=Paenirhodobacter populi TaxID=2306993 RepID=A0A443KIH5_9RHOB|nr:LysR family transcriptional regulator [Sinirhodobacter populi]RWR32563.1 LysR family transcriptional regulator [Sinirhodobacter populi]